jgi:hypothetical protein
MKSLGSSFEGKLFKITFTVNVIPTKNKTPFETEISLNIRDEDFKTYLKDMKSKYIIRKPFFGEKGAVFRKTDDSEWDKDNTLITINELIDGKTKILLFSKEKEVKKKTYKIGFKLGLLLSKEETNYLKLKAL